MSSTPPDSCNCWIGENGVSQEYLDIAHSTPTGLVYWPLFLSHIKVIFATCCLRVYRASVCRCGKSILDTSSKTNWRYGLIGAQNEPYVRIPVSFLSIPPNSGMMRVASRYDWVVVVYHAGACRFTMFG